MRIAVVHNLVDGGARRRLAEQVSALDAEVVEFTTSLAVPVTARPYVVPCAPVAPHLPSALRPPWRMLDLYRLTAAWRLLGEMAASARPDAVFVNSDSVLRGSMPYEGRGAPVVRFCDEPRRIDYEPALRDSINPRTRALYAGLRRRERRLDRTAMASADAIVTNSRYTAARIRAAYGRDADVLPCGAPAAMTPDPAVRPRHLLTVGSLIASKGHDLVIQAAAHSGLGFPVVLIAHHGAPREEARLHAIAARHGVALSIRTGIPDGELVSLYRAAYATLYLAAAEPLGLVSLEAQACGSPVVVAGEGGLPETVVAGRTGLVVPRTAAGAGEALAALSRCGRRDEMAALAATNPGGHTWPASAAALTAVFERLGHTRARVGTAR